MFWMLRMIPHLSIWRKLQLLHCRCFKVYISLRTQSVKYSSCYLFQNKRFNTQKLFTGYRRLKDPKDSEIVQSGDFGDGTAMEWVSRGFLELVHRELDGTESLDVCF